MYAKTKRLLAMVLTLCMVMGVMPIGAAAAGVDSYTAYSSVNSKIRSLKNNTSEQSAVIATYSTTPSCAWNAIDTSAYPGGEWIWVEAETKANTTSVFGDIVEVTETFTLNGDGVGSVFVAADNAYIIFFNGYYIGQSITLNRYGIDKDTAAGLRTDGFAPGDAPFMVTPGEPSAGDYAETLKSLIPFTNGTKKLDETIVNTNHSSWNANTTYQIPSTYFNESGVPNVLKIIALNEYMHTDDRTLNPYTGVWTGGQNSAGSPSGNPAGLYYYFTTESVPVLSVMKFIDTKPYFEVAGNEDPQSGPTFTLDVLGENDTVVNSIECRATSTGKVVFTNYTGALQAGTKYRLTEMGYPGFQLSAINISGAVEGSVVKDIPNGSLTFVAGQQTISINIYNVSTEEDWEPGISLIKSSDVEDFYAFDPADPSKRLPMADKDGDTVTYTLAVTNTGESGLVGLTLTDGFVSWQYGEEMHSPLKPLKDLYVTNSLTVEDDDENPVTVNDIAFGTDGVMTVTLDPDFMLKAGESLTITYAVEYPESTAWGTDLYWNNKATVKGYLPIGGDPLTSDDTDTVIQPANPKYGFELSKEVVSIGGVPYVDGIKAEPGNLIVFMVTLENKSNMSFTYDFEDSMTGKSGFDGPFIDADGKIATDWTHPIPAYETVSLYYTYVVPSTLADIEAVAENGKIVNTFSVSNVEYEDETLDRDTEAEVEIPLAHPAFTVKKEVLDYSNLFKIKFVDANVEADAALHNSGGIATFKITVTNTGTLAGTVTLADTLSDEIKDAQLVNIPGNTWPDGDIKLSAGESKSFIVLVQLPENKVEAPAISLSVADQALIDAYLTAYENVDDARIALATAIEALANADVAFDNDDTSDVAVALKAAQDAFELHLSFGEYGALKAAAADALAAYEQAVDAYNAMTRQVTQEPVYDEETGDPVLDEVTGDPVTTDVYESDADFFARMEAAFKNVEALKAIYDAAASDATLAELAGLEAAYLLAQDAYDAAKLAHLAPFVTAIADAEEDFADVEAILNAAQAGIAGIDTLPNDLPAIQALLDEIRAGKKHTKGYNRATLSGSYVDNGEDDAYVSIKPELVSSIEVDKAVGLAKDGPFYPALTLDGPSEVWYRLRIANTGLVTEWVVIDDIFEGTSIVNDLKYADGSALKLILGRLRIEPGKTVELFYQANLENNLPGDQKYLEHQVYTNVLHISYRPGDDLFEKEITKEAEVPVVVAPVPYANVQISKKVYDVKTGSWGESAVVYQDEAAEFTFSITLENKGTGEAVVKLSDEMAGHVFYANQTCEEAAKLVSNTVTLGAGEAATFYCKVTVQVGEKRVNTAAFTYDADENKTTPINPDGGEDTADAEVKPAPKAYMWVDKVVDGETSYVSDVEVEAWFKITITNTGLKRGTVYLTDTLTNPDGSPTAITQLYKSKSTEDINDNIFQLSTVNGPAPLEVAPNSSVTFFYPVTLTPPAEGFDTKVYVNTVTITKGEGDDTTIIEKGKDEADVKIKLPVYVYAVRHEYYVSRSSGITHVGTLGPDDYTTTDTTVNADGIARLTNFHDVQYAFTNITHTGIVEITNGKVTIVLTYVRTVSEREEIITYPPEPVQPTTPPTTPTPTTPEEPIVIENPLTSLDEDVEDPIEEEEIELEDVLADLPATGVLSFPVSVRWTLGTLAILASMGVLLTINRKKEEQE